MRINKGLIWDGLLNSDRETLSIFIALFEDSKGLSLVSDKILDVKSKTQKLYESSFSKSETQVMPDDIKDHFSQRIEKTAKTIYESELSDEALKTALWEQLLNALRLNNNDFMSPRDITRHCDDIANCMVQNATVQKNKESKTFTQKINPSKKTKSDTLSFENAVEYLVSKITEEAIEQDANIISGIKQEISTLDNQIIQESGASNLTEGAISKTLVTSGSLLGLMVGVQAAGFSAYIMAAQASAIIPLVGGKTLVSLLFVVTNPFFVIPAVIGTGIVSNNSLEKSIKQSFAMIVSTMLLMRGMIKEDKIFETEKLLGHYKEHIAAISQNPALRKVIKNKTREEWPALANVELPSISVKEQSLLTSKVEVQNKNGQQILKIYPSSIKNIDNAAIAGLTFADFIYDVAAIAPQVVEATDFARKADISDVFEFSIFSEGLAGLSEASLRGHHANLMGYTAERLVASQLVKDGHVVEIPTSSSQPGYDLLVDGNEFQVKCIEPENFSILERHFDKYPDTPVFVNSELADVVAEKSPDWSDLVFYVGGYTHEKASGMLTQAIEAGQELDDYEILSSVAVVSAVRNTLDWQKGDQTFQSATFNIALDSLSKGGMAIAGGVAGTGLGMLLFGPAGAYVLGGVSTVFGATQGNILTNQLDKFLDPDREEKLCRLSNELLETCNVELKKKIDLLDQKISVLSNEGISAYVRYRLTWDKIACQIAVKRHEASIKASTFNGTKKIFKALKLASESTVHPYCLQKQYVEIADTLNQKVDRFDKVGGRLKRLINKE